MTRSTPRPRTPTMRPSLTAMSIASPLECSTEAACAHRSTSDSATPSSSRRSTRAGHESPGAYGVRSPQGSAIRSTISGGCTPTGAEIGACTHRYVRHLTTWGEARSAEPVERSLSGASRDRKSPRQDSPALARTPSYAALPARVARAPRAGRLRPVEGSRHRALDHRALPRRLQASEGAMACGALSHRHAQGAREPGAEALPRGDRRAPRSRRGRCPVHVTSRTRRSTSPRGESVFLSEQAPAGGSRALGCRPRRHAYDARSTASCRPDARRCSPRTCVVIVALLALSPHHRLSWAL